MLEDKKVLLSHNQIRILYIKSTLVFFFQLTHLTLFKAMLYYRYVKILHIILITLYEVELIRFVSMEVPPSSITKRFSATNLTFRPFPF